MNVVHTLLFFIRDNHITGDMAAAATCLKSLEKSTNKTVIIYNQGVLTNEQVAQFVAGFKLDCHIIGTGKNVGTTISRQSCFETIWNNFKTTAYISEIHLDMIFNTGWEDPLTEYLNSHDEPLISCGIIDQGGNLPFLNQTAHIPTQFKIDDSFLNRLRQDTVVHGFTNPCIHVSEILKETGGYNPQFLKGMQCFEDDSMLLGYYYYYGTKWGWYPKINYNSVVYHAVAGQRLDILGHNVLVNYQGLVNQYGAMGLKHLSELHQSPWHKQYFGGQFEEMIKR